MFFQIDPHRNDPEMYEPAKARGLRLTSSDILTFDREDVARQTRSLDYDEGEVRMRINTVVTVDDFISQ